MSEAEKPPISGSLPADTEAQYLRYLQLCEQEDEHPMSIAEFARIYKMRQDDEVMVAWFSAYYSGPHDPDGDWNDD